MKYLTLLLLVCWWQGIAMAENYHGKVMSMDNRQAISEATIQFFNDNVFIGGGKSALEFVNKYENVLVVQTFSKSRSMAGIRLGYAIGPESIIEGLNRLKFSFNSYTIDRISIEAGIESFKDDEYFKRMNKKIVETRENTIGKLEKLGFKVLNSSANFIFISHKYIHAEEIYKNLILYKKVIHSF